MENSILTPDEFIEKALSSLAADFSMIKKIIQNVDSSRVENPEGLQPIEIESKKALAALAGLVGEIEELRKSAA